MSQLLKTRNPSSMEEPGLQDTDSDTSASPHLVINTPPSGMPSNSPMGVTVPLSTHITVLRNGTGSPRHMSLQPALAGRYVPLQPHQVQQLQQQHLLQTQLAGQDLRLPVPPTRVAKTGSGLAIANGVPTSEGAGREQSNSAEYILNRVPGTDNRVLLSSGRYATIDPSMLGPINALMAVANQRPLPTPESETQPGIKQHPHLSAPPQPPPAPPTAAAPPPPTPTLPPPPAPEPAKKRRRKKAEKAGPEEGAEKTPKPVAKRLSSPNRKALPEKAAISRSESASVLEGLAKKVRRNSVDSQAVEKAMPVLVKEGEGGAAQPVAV